MCLTSCFSFKPCRHVFALFAFKFAEHELLFVCPIELSHTILVRVLVWDFMHNGFLNCTKRKVEELNFRHALICIEARKGAQRRWSINSFTFSLNGMPHVSVQLGQYVLYGFPGKFFEFLGSLVWHNCTRASRQNYFCFYLYN